MSDLHEKKNAVSDQNDPIDQTADEIVEETMKKLLADIDLTNEAQDVPVKESEKEEYLEKDPDSDKEVQEKERPAEAVKDDKAGQAEAAVVETEKVDKTNPNKNESAQPVANKVTSGKEQKEKQPKKNSLESKNVENMNAKNKGPSGQGTLKKKLLIASGVVLGLILAVYIGFAVFFMSHFYFNTKINGEDFSLKTVADVEDYLKEHVSGYELTLHEKNEQTEIISGDEIEIAYKKDDKVKKILDKQNAFLWVTSFFNKESSDVTVEVEYSKEALTNKMNSLKCITEVEQIPPQNAHSQFNGEAFEIVPEVSGTQVKVEEFEQHLNEAVSTLQTELDMEAMGCYAMPVFTSESPEVIAARDVLNDYLRGSVTYDFNPETVVVGGELLASWLIVDEAMNVTLNHEAVAAYVGELKARFDTVGTVRTIAAPNGKTVEVSGGDYGWNMDAEAETAALIASLEAREVVTREPAYKRRGAGRGANDYGGTYAEVDLTAQHMWFIKDGVVVLETPVVTGLPRADRVTPQGSYDLTYKKSPSILRAPLRPDGTREYETPVKYWMPFNGGIGFHDATWQSSFGGDRYLSRGSHGCINMPLDKAGELYSLIEQGMPVVCHY